MFPLKQLHFIVLCAKTLVQHGITTEGNQLLRKLVSLQKNHLGVWKKFIHVVRLTHSTAVTGRSLDL